MPWKRNRSGGYSTARGGNIKRPSVYEALRRRGMSKAKAAKIANRKKSR